MRRLRLLNQGLVVAKDETCQQRVTMFIIERSDAVTNLISRVRHPSADANFAILASTGAVIRYHISAAADALVEY